MSWFQWILITILLITLIFGWGFLLWVLTETLSKLINFIGFFFSIVYNFVTGKWITGKKKVNKYFYDLALSKDQHTNVVVRDFFNVIMLRSRSIPFGDPDKTISWYFAINKLIHDRCDFKCGLNPFGLFIAKILDLFEKKAGGHLEVSLRAEMIKEKIILEKYNFPSKGNLPEYKQDIVNEFLNHIA
jgi:hypothetical protein